MALHHQPNSFLRITTCQLILVLQSYDPGIYWEVSLDPTSKETWKKLLQVGTICLPMAVAAQLT